MRAFDRWTWLEFVNNNKKEVDLGIGSDLSTSECGEKETTTTKNRKIEQIPCHPIGIVTWSTQTYSNADGLIQRKIWNAK